jgi:hypothetical protein
VHVHGKRKVLKRIVVKVTKIIVHLTGKEMSKGPLIVFQIITGAVPGNFTPVVMPTCHIEMSDIPNNYDIQHIIKCKKEQ